MDQERGLRSRIERAGAEVASRLGWVSRGGGGGTPAPAAPPDDEEEALDGWGFKDTRFVVKPDGHVTLTGRRYNLSGLDLPKLLPWLSGVLRAPLAYDNRNVPHYPPAIPPARRDEALLKALRDFLRDDQVSDEPLVRLRHGHGHTGAEIWAIRYGRLPRVPDLVVFPEAHAEVERLVEVAHARGACLVPFGGGTNVTDALRLPVDEARVVVVLDLRRMNKLRWVDPVNRTACIEAGATGRHIAAELAKHGLTLGHEPDSAEFSTLGGWIATNASGMKKNRYGNIEDIVLDVTAVTTRGVIERPAVGPRESVGVNPKTFLFGSEGNLGVITSAVVKVWPLPEVQRYASVIFPDLEHGFQFLYDLQQSGAVPASVRVMDNTQFHFGQALKPASKGLAARLKSQAEALVVTRIKGFDPHKMCVATVVFEGTAAEVAFQEQTLRAIAARHGGLQGGAANGERGYQLTFGIAYIRDLAFEHWAIAESFETSVPWSRALELYERVKRRVELEHERRRLPGRPFFTGRITQVYSTGVAMYFYLGFYAKGVADPVAEYAALEHAAREEILASGGTLSHHHGVGKIRQDFLDEVYSEGARTVVREVKRALDPDNLFGASNHGVRGAVALAGEAEQAP
ncbi:FAD-binding oxidoreductase [Sorangium sp. So ce513]|uniref:FAD-binding oxidoreductase n=1 Tax=Sorangium sp. So ce513 TaxID=3133315 RepID=UPI003F5F5945